MNVMPKNGGLVSLGGGSAVASKRPAGVPTLVNGPLLNAQFLWEDFTHGTIIADPTLGNPAWVPTEIVGATGSIGISQSSATSLSNGTLQMISGTTSGNCMAADHGGISATVGAGWLRNSTSTSNLFAVRFMHNGSVTAGSQTGRYGFGFVNPSSATIGADWITDPDTTLNNSQSIVIHRDGAAAYSGDTRGDIVLRVYSTDTATSSVLVSAAQQTTDGASFWYKVEVLCTGTVVYAWVNGVLTSQIACTTWGTTQLRFSAQVMSTSAAARQLNLDYVYAENSNTAAR